MIYCRTIQLVIPNTNDSQSRILSRFKFHCRYLQNEATVSITADYYRKVSEYFNCVVIIYDILNICTESSNLYQQKLIVILEILLFDFFDQIRQIRLKKVPV